MKKLIFNFGLLCALFLACSKDDNNVVPTISSVTIKNLAADPPSGGYDPTNGRPIGETMRFTFFRFADSSIVANADSASTKWDIGFRANTIILNSGTSGPGSATAYVQSGIFSDFKSIPADSIFRQDQSPNLAIGKSWYSYDGAAMVFNPKPGKILVIKTNDNKYVKLEILSYYKNAPASPNAFTDQARYYTFRYVHQSDGTKQF